MSYTDSQCGRAESSWTKKAATSSIPSPHPPRNEGKFSQAMENYVDNPTGPTPRRASTAA